MVLGEDWARVGACVRCTKPGLGYFRRKQKVRGAGPGGWYPSLAASRTVVVVKLARLSLRYEGPANLKATCLK